MPLANARGESHQVFAMDNTISANPIAEPAAPRDRPRRNLTCAASVTSHDSSKPNNAAFKIETNACCGAQRSSTNARTIANEEATTARVGDPARFRTPSDAGAHPFRASANSVRDDEYNAAFAADNA